MLPDVAIATFLWFVPEAMLLSITVVSFMLLSLLFISLWLACPVLFLLIGIAMCSGIISAYQYSNSSTARVLSGGFRRTWGWTLGLCLVLGRLVERSLEIGIMW